MFIEQPLFLYKLFFRGAYWRIPSEDQKVVYLTFDDGPIPHITPWVLDVLDHYNIKATFFCVGDNVVKHPEIYQDIIRRGHKVGNHTFNHLQGIKTTTDKYAENVDLAAQHIQSKLFRPPHGHMRSGQVALLRQKYNIVMWDVITRDYSKRQTPQQVLRTVKKYTRNGSIVVFHDSIKAEKNMKYALPLAIEWLLEQGYVFKIIQEQVIEEVETSRHNSESDSRELVHGYR
ncbi:MAG: hypothetical protein RL662_1234 [Bacteroidota bacterium]|jgi:peptidoglycan/xylan/chitin deacetylase (PgdA/CDA1 family)